MQFKSAARISTIATIVSLTAACQTVSDTSELSNQNKFSIASSANYTLSRSASRQFDIGYGVDFKPTIAKSGTGQYTCEAGFKYAPQNNGLSKADINALGNSPERKQQVRSTLGSLFKISSFSTIKIQGYVGYRMNVEPKIGPDASNARGQIVFVETPRGRMTQVCITNAASFGSAVSKFSALTNAIRLPE